MKIREFMGDVVDNTLHWLDNVFSCPGIIPMIWITTLLGAICLKLCIIAYWNEPAYRSDKTQKYELYMLGGFKDTLESRYEPDQLRIRSFRGSYSLEGEGTHHVFITIKNGCVDFKPIK